MRYDIRVHADGKGLWRARVRNDTDGFIRAGDDRAIALAKRAGRAAIMRELRLRGNGQPIRTAFEYSFGYAVHIYAQDGGVRAGGIDYSRFHYIDVIEKDS